MIIMFTGLPGAGKSMETARVALDTLWRNHRYYQKTGIVRHLYSNLKFSEHVESVYGDYIRYWTDTADLVKLKDVDVFWDEMAAHLDATQWQNMSLELKRWLQQHRKLGIDIYGNSQDFAQVDKSARRLVGTLYHFTKLIGSRDISATRPAVQFVWGLIFMKSIDPQTYDEMKSKQNAQGIGFRFIRKEYIQAFDTRQPVPVGKYPPLRHMERDCERSDCAVHKVIHV